VFLPTPRGPLSAGVVAALRDGAVHVLPSAVIAPIDPLADDDLQLALWMCFELHYQGFDEVSDRWEWEPGLIAFRRRLEDITLSALRSEISVPAALGRRVADRLRELVAADDGPSVARYIQSQAGPDEFAEFARHRSLYQLKEADPHTWAVPRLRGRAKAALIEIQTDEYGNGRVHDMHSELFRNLLTECGLDASYGAYLNDVPGITLAISNVMSLFGLRRELRGALVGHLAAYEMTSSEPCRRYAQGLRRLGGSDAACAFYDVHVTADALHEQLAAHDLCEGLAADEPALTEDILFGAAACLHVDNRFARHVLDAWAAGRSSLYENEQSLAVAS
jgi:hypothetical protein